MITEDITDSTCADKCTSVHTCVYALHTDMCTDREVVLISQNFVKWESTVPVCLVPDTLFPSCLMFIPLCISLPFYVSVSIMHVYKHAHIRTHICARACAPWTSSFTVLGSGTQMYKGPPSQRLACLHTCTHMHIVRHLNMSTLHAAYP